MSSLKSGALSFVFASLVLTGCRSNSDFTGFYNFAHPPKDITNSTILKIEKTGDEYFFVPIVNNKFHQCVPSGSRIEAHLATNDELIGLTDQQNNSSVKALVAPRVGTAFFGAKDNVVVRNIHAASGIIIHVDGNGLQEATRTKECVPFVPSGN